jgi:hypothetical protein
MVDAHSSRESTGLSDLVELAGLYDRTFRGELDCYTFLSMGGDHIGEFFIDPNVATEQVKAELESRSLAYEVALNYQPGSDLYVAHVKVDRDMAGMIAAGLRGEM